MKLKQFWIITLAVGLVGCSSDTDTETREGLSMQQQMTQRQAVNNQRSEIAQAMDDQALARFLWQQEQHNYYWVLETLAFDSTPYEIEYTLPRLERLADYDDIASMHEAYLGSLLALYRSDFRNCLRYSAKQGFRVQQGFTFPFPHTVAFEQMIMDDQSSLRLPESDQRDRQSQDIVRAGDNYCFSAPLQEAGPQPLKVTGRLETMLPEALVEFSLSASDVGKAKQKNGYTVTLLELNDYSYAIEVASQDPSTELTSVEAIIAEAQAADGRYIRHRVTGKQPPGHTTRMDDLLSDLFSEATRGNIELTDAEQQVTALQQQLDEEQSKALYAAYAFHGPVETVKVTLLAGAETPHEQHFELPVYSFDPPETIASDEGLDPASLPTVEATPPVYDGRPVVRAQYQDLDAFAMDELIEIRQRSIPLDTDPSLKFPAQVFLHYPEVQSDLFLRIFDRYSAPSPDNVTFYNAEGQSVELREEEGGQTSAFTFMVSRLEYDPDAFTETPHRMRAVIPVTTTPNMVKERYARDELPAGVVLTGNRLVIDYAEFEPQEIADVTSRRVDRRNQVFVRDNHGYLAEIDVLSITRQGDQPVDVYYFYGTPEFFEIWYRGETEQVDWAIDIKL